MFPSDEVLDEITLRTSLPKLSTSLLEVAAPLLDRSDDEVDADALEAAFRVAWMAWIRTSTDTDETVAKIRAAASKLPPGADGELARVVLGEIEDRRRELFAHDPRIPGEVEITDDGEGGFNVRVPTLRTPALERWLAEGAAVDLRRDLAPDFLGFVRTHELDHRFLSHGVPTTAADAAGFERRRISLRWWFEYADWEAPPLARLFRGDREPPSDDALSRYPVEYVPLFHAIETGVILGAGMLGVVPTDREVREVYSCLRRRPDGRGPGRLFDAVWQAAALELAKSPYSAAEFEAVVRQLERSVRRHRTWECSRGYHEFLREQFHVAGG